MSKTRRWLVLATVSAGLLMVSVDTTVLYTALPTLTRDLQADASQKLWIINAYPLVMAGLLLGAGTLGDRIGHKRMFLTGLALFAAASLLAAFAPSPPVLIAARAFLAVGAAAMLPATAGTDPHHLRRRTRARHRHRRLGHHGGTRRRTGPDRRRPAAPALLVGLGLPPQHPRRAARPGRDGRCSCRAARATATAPGT